VPERSAEKSEAATAVEPVPSPQPPSVAAESKPPTAPAPAASEASDPATLGQYRIALITAAKRYKRYPRVAIDNNWEGQTDIRMVIGADGGIASMSIRKPSGYEVLDQQALEMIRKAKPLAPIPASLRGKGFTVDIPVLFSLKEETG
jgi:protein TonB